MRQDPADHLFAAAGDTDWGGSRRAASLAISVCLHLGLIGGLAWLSGNWHFYVAPRPYEFAEEKAPPERFVLYYQPPELPAISPTAHDDEPPIEPDVLATQRMISVSETPTENQTRVYLPDAPPTPEPKVEAENLIVVNPEPEPAPVRRTAPKAFTVPIPQRKVEDALIEVEPALPVAIAKGPVVTPTSSALDNLPDAPPRAATAPEGAKPVETAAADSRASSTEPDPSAQGPSATIAVVTPTPAAGKTPVTSAEADFRVGPPGSRDTGGKGLGGVEGAVTSVPNLAVSAPRSLPPAATPKPEAAAIPRGPIVAPTRTLLSVALRPGMRRLPPAVEEVFAKRDVYVYLLETRADGRRGPDWTIWFADIAVAPLGRPPLVRPPVPAKPIPVSGLLAAVRTDGRTIHLRGVIRRSGEFEAAAAAGDEAKDRVAGVLRDTPFLPANRNGVATDVDVVIEVQGVK